MHVGKSYSFGEFLFWTRRNACILLLWGILPVVLYEVAEWHWINIPWPVVALLGTAAAFTVGFKNTQTYNRTGEAQNIWTSIIGISRTWGLFSRDFLEDDSISKDLVYRHLAWLTTLRHELRSSRPWETIKKHNAEYLQFYCIPENEVPLGKELDKLLTTVEAEQLGLVLNKSGNLLFRQGQQLKWSYQAGKIGVPQFIEMERTLKELLVLQSRCEQMKNSPYPRQYAIVNLLFVRLFCALLPFGMLKEFDKLNELVSGFMHGHMVWTLIPFSVMVSWMYLSLEQVGESTENPFAGSANDVPISQIARDIEIEMREMLGEEDIPVPLRPRNNIIL
jgi:putative membrane protein